MRESACFNGNRYAVIATPQDTIPDSLPIKDPTTGAHTQIRITFKGQARFCGRCNVPHVGQCPQLAAFYKAKEERDRMEKEGEICVKIFSDSTLRHAKSLGLKAEVMVM